VLGAAMLAHGADAPQAAGPFQPTWESLKAHQDPAWFRDAKFGIYTHWGPVTVGSEDCPHIGTPQWYGMDMYNPSSPLFDYHKKKFGDQATFGYKELIPLFTADKFDANEWADLFAKAGAKFAGPVAVHHDNFAMWDSAITPWNAMKMGPKRDIVGELAKAYKARGMKFVPTFHHGFAWRYFEPAFKFDAADGKNPLLYTEPHAAKAPPSKRFQDQWLAMVMEVVQKYEPDMIWFDFELNEVITPEYQRLMFADYYNWAATNHTESAVAHKFTSIQKFTGILDFERGREDRLAPYPWLTDTVLANWFNQKATPYRSADYMIDLLADIVSKNGCMLLDVSPAVDGSIPPEARKVLLEMGGWLQLNGEAIYGTRPWLAFGEGPTKAKKGGFGEDSDKGFVAQDIRFTTKGDALFAIALGWPTDGKLVIRSLATDAGKVTAVELLGSAGALAWHQGDAGLEITLPDKPPCDFAYVFKVTGTDLKPAAAGQTSTVSQPAADGTIALLPAMADLHGSPVRVEQAKIAVVSHNGQDFVSNWERADESASWKIRFPGPGTYQVTATCRAPAGDTGFVLELSGQQLGTALPKSPEVTTLTLGKFTVDQAGVAELAVRAKDPARWQPLEISAIRLVPAR
jgi:alpha-L-fucosidase